MPRLHPQALGLLSRLLAWGAHTLSRPPCLQRPAHAGTLTRTFVPLDTHRKGLLDLHFQRAQAPWQRSSPPPLCRRRGAHSTTPRSSACSLCSRATRHGDMSRAHLTAELFAIRNLTHLQITISPSMPSSSREGRVHELGT